MAAGWGRVVVGLLVVVLAAPGLASAQQDPVYDASGGQYGRGFFSPLPFERIDIVTGNVFLSFTDLSLPGDGLLGLGIVRTYNSRDGQWRFGIGGVPLRFQFNLPNGSLDDIDFITADGAKHNAEGAGSTTLTQGFWQFTKSTRVLEMPNGLVLTYGHLVSNVGWYLTEIRDPFDNTITLTWQSGTDSLQTITQGVGGATREVTFSGWTDDRAVSMTYGSTTWTYTWSTALPGPPQLMTVAPPGGATWGFTYAPDPQNATKIASLTTVNGGTVNYEWEIQTFPTTPSQRVAIAERTTGGRAVAGTWTFNWQDTGRLLEIHTPVNIVTYATVVVDDVPVKTQRWVHGPGEILMERETVTHTSIAHPVSGQVPVVDTVTLERDGLTFTTTYTYDASNAGTHWSNYGQPIQVVQSEGLTRTTVITYEHDFSKYIRGRVASTAVTVGGQTVTRESTYDSTTGFLTSTTDSDVMTTFAPNAQGHVASVTDAAGRTTTFAYDWGVVSSTASPDNAVVVTRTINPNGTVASETVVGSGATTHYTYDAAGRVETVSTTPAGRQSATTSYTVQSGAWVATTTTRGTVSVTTDLDGWGQPTHTVDSAGVHTGRTYNAVGQVTDQSRPYGGSGGTAVAQVDDEFSYDHLGRRTLVERPDGSYVETFYNGASIGVQESLTSGYRGTTQYFHWFGPGDGQMWRLVDAIGGDWRYSYNHRSQLTEVWKENDPTGPLRTWEYDAKGRPWRQTQPESGTSITQYDTTVGNVIYTEDARGPSVSGTTYTYDTNHRLILADAPDTEYDVTTTYDSAGRTKTVGNATVQTTLEYDAFSRVRERTDVIAGRPFTQTYTYDAYDNLVEAVYPLSGRRVIYEYDSQQRLSAVKTAIGGDTPTPLADTFVYWGNGSLKSYRFGNNQTASFAQDARQRPTTWTSGPLALTYAHDPVGNVESITDGRGAAYDQTFTYDGLDRMLTVTKNALTTTYTYNGAGDRLTENDGVSTITFNYNNSTRQLESLSGSGAPTGTFEYDLVGSMTKDPFGAEFSYNALNKLRTSKPYNGQTTTYEYGAGGIRAVKTGPDGIPHVFVYGGGSGPIAEYRLVGADAIPVRETVYMGGQILASFEPHGISPPPLAVTLTAQPTTIASGQTVTLEATATASGGLTIARVEFFVRGLLLASDTSAPYAATWTNTPLGPGSYVFHARVVATNGQAVASYPVTVVVQ